MSAAQPANSPTDAPSREQDALNRILRSDVLHRAPNLVLFLRYVCERQMEGRTADIKEYNIAVEALGRSSDFDQKKDSIVRVEAHRLRKRLSEYYQRAGAEDPVQILLPPGSYVPVFWRVADTPESQENTDKTDVQQGVPPDAEPLVATQTGWQARPAWLLTFAGLGLAALGIAGWSRWPTGVPASEPIQQRGRAAGVLADARPEGAIRIAAGSAREIFAEGTGAAWHKDRFYSGGQVITATPRSIRRSTDDALYLTKREGDFEYTIPVPAGYYELRLHFAETVFGEENVAGGGESSRIFQVQVNGGEIWTADIISEAAGENTAIVRVYRNVRPRDGAIRVAFRPSRKEAAFVNGIEVLPAPDARSLPVRLVGRSSSLILPSGEEWGRDRYSLGGTTVQRHEPVQGPEPSALYEAERFGNFSYAIPVAPGTRYTLILRFAETWFGQGRPGGGGEGSRVFDVYCNRKILLKNFDVLSEAGEPLRQVKRIFRNLEPNAQGQLNVQFVPIQNYAMINAIEVIDEGR